MKVSVKIAERIEAETFPKFPTSRALQEDSFATRSPIPIRSFMGKVVADTDGRRDLERARC
jgi:hypothetical protein